MRNGEESEKNRVYRALASMIRKGFRPMGVGDCRYVMGHIVHMPPEPSRSQFRWHLYKACSCYSWKMANGSPGNGQEAFSESGVRTRMPSCVHLGVMLARPSAIVG